MRWLSLRSNNISDVTPLARFENLEELVLDNNQLTSIDALCALRNLTRLDAQHNFITAVNTAFDFKVLLQLNLSSNAIVDLHPFVAFPSLIELCTNCIVVLLIDLDLANNKVKEINQLFCVKEASRLLVLDLAGNAVCQRDLYRLFLIYHRPSIKAPLLRNLMLTKRYWTGSQWTQKRFRTPRKSFWAN